MLRRLWKLAAFVAVAAGYTLYAGAAVRSTSSRRERAQAMARRQQRGARRLLRILGVRVTVNGPDPEALAAERPTLLVCNHLGLLDPFVLAARLRMALVGKAEIDDWPVAGWVARTMGVLFVERGRGVAVEDFVARVQKRLRTGGVPVLAFPEGTTNERPQVLPFKTGVFSSVAGQEGEAVLPLYLHVRSVDGVPADGTRRRRVIWSGGTESAGAHAWRLLGLRRVEMELRVGTPIDAGAHGRRALARRAQDQVEAMADDALG